MSQLTAVSLFAGVGGFDLALERNGVRVAASVEIDKQASTVLSRRFPNSVLFGDIKEVTGGQLIQAGFRPEAGIITGGFPCQDLSVAGRREGLAGQRSGLFWHIVRLLGETQSRYFILENVPGLLSSRRGEDMGTVVATLVELGYSVSWRVLNAQYFGVPQRRRRVFIVGSLGAHWRSPSEILALVPGRRWYLAQSGGARKDIASPTAGSPRSPGILGSSIVGSLAARDFKGVGSQYVNENKVVVESASVVLPIHDQATRHAGKRGDKQDGKGNGLGIGGAGDPMNTLTRGDRHAVASLAVSMHHREGKANDEILVASTVRRLTPVECERLQGFPDGWTDGQADGHRYTQMGNAVAVPVAEWVVSRLVASHDGALDSWPGRRPVEHVDRDER
ncbi:MAG: DNA cytosine methyltransferase [Kineosporiaceae bacterium]|nr:DNA cytosine methyltransferase [Kineosporiaceae bacterium]MBK8077592.1 DNA cytosine methyltransferase [Kineosporiaceae bacterium]